MSDTRMPVVDTATIQPGTAASVRSPPTSESGDDEIRRSNAAAFESSASTRWSCSSSERVAMSKTNEALGGTP